MKTRFEDLTRDQVLALTEEDIKYYTQYRLAQEGIILPPYPDDAPEEKTFPEPTEEAFECRGILVTDMKEAQLIATLESIVDTDYNSGDYNYKYLKEASTYNSGIDRKKFYKKEVLKEFQKELKAYNKEKSIYESELNTYNKALKESESITSFISDIIDAVISENRYLERARNRYTELIELAQDNEQIAYNFFVKAYPIESTVEILEDFYKDNSIYGISVLSYADFMGFCGIKELEETIES